jgi:hypothetical protein
MIKNIKVEITIKDIERDRYYSFPILPDTIQYTNGDTIAQSISIVDLGAVEVPNGRDLDSFGFTSEFPARYDAGYVVISQSALKKPIDYKNLFEGIKARQAPVQLIVPVLGINKTMFIQSFNPGFAGFEGDIPFAIGFRELRTIRPKKLTPGGTAPPKGKKQPADRPKAAAKPKPKTYTVVSGDTLIKIAKKLGIADWRGQLYNPNKKVIGPDPNKIKPGQVLKL